MKPAVRRFACCNFTRRASALLGALVALSGLCSRVDAAGKGPKSVPVQIGLAEEMAANQDWDETMRRWVQILYYFGPSDQEARAEFEIGVVALHRGRSDLAISQWQKALLRHPEGEWVERARAGLKLLGKELPTPPAEPAAPYITADTPSDERQFLIAEGDAALGLYRFAIRDYLKIPNTYPNSDRAPEARFRIGTCQALLGRPELAVQQWDRLIQDYPDSPQANMARAGIAAWEAVLKTVESYAPWPPLPADKTEWRPFRRYATSPDQGLSYAEDLYENRIFAYALQEYTKVLCDIYTPKGGSNPHKPYARYRMGICAYRLGERDAAARQWSRLIADFPDSAWATHANRALAAVGITDPFSSDAGRLAPALPADLPSQLVQRFHLAHQLVDCGLPLVASKEYLKVMVLLTAGKPNPFQAETCFKLGVTQHLRGRPDLALATWGRVMEEHPNSAWAEKAETAISQARQREAALAQSAAPPEEPGS
jgi:TolA-binding protein